MEVAIQVVASFIFIFEEKEDNMVIFNELKFSDDVKNLSINVSIETASQSNYYIHAIYLEYYKNRNVSKAPSGKAVVLFENPAIDPETHEPVGNPDTTKKSWEGTVNESVLSLNTNGVDKFKDGLFYVIVVCQNVDYEHHEDDLVADVDAVLDWTAVYSRGMAIVNSALVGCGSGKCAISDNLEQAILCWHSIELSMAANDADALDRLWSRFVQFTPITGNVGVSPCNCM